MPPADPLPRENGWDCPPPARQMMDRLRQQTAFAPLTGASPPEDLTMAADLDPPPPPRNAFF